MWCRENCGLELRGTSSHTHKHKLWSPYGSTVVSIFPNLLDKFADIRCFPQSQMIYWDGVCNLKLWLYNFCHIFLKPGGFVIREESSQVRPDSSDITTHHCVGQSARALLISLNSLEALTVCLFIESIHPPVKKTLRLTNNDSMHWSTCKNVKAQVTQRCVLWLKLHFCTTDYICLVCGTVKTLILVLFFRPVSSSFLISLFKLFISTFFSLISNVRD